MRSTLLGASVWLLLGASTTLWGCLGCDTLAQSSGVGTANTIPPEATAVQPEGDAGTRGPTSANVPEVTSAPESNDTSRDTTTDVTVESSAADASTVEPSVPSHAGELDGGYASEPEDSSFEPEPLPTQAHMTPPVPPASLIAVDPLLPNPHELKALVDEPGLPESLCDDALLAPEFTADDTSELAVLHVNASSNVTEPDGSADAPYQTITEALAVATSPVVIKVAVGEYVETLAVPAGVRLLGGFDAATWRREPESFTTLRAPTLNFDGSVASDVSVLEGFYVYAKIFANASARLLLRNNLLVAPKFEDEMLAPRVRAQFVWSTNATLRAEFNALVVDAANADDVVSHGFWVESSCAYIAENRFYGVQIPAVLYKSNDAVFAFNVVGDGSTGVDFNASDGMVVGNYFECFPPPVGAVYVMYMEDDSRPTLRDNTLYLGGFYCGGINEASDDSDPFELTNTTFIVPDGSTIYFDRDGDTLTRINDIESVNALTDITKLEGNVLTLER